MSIPVLRVLRKVHVEVAQQHAIICPCQWPGWLLGKTLASFRLGSSRDWHLIFLHIFSNICRPSQLWGCFYGSHTNKAPDSRALSLLPTGYAMLQQILSDTLQSI